MKKICLSKEWGGYPVGQVLEVLVPGEDLRINAVDPIRATRLLEDGFAVEGDHLPESPAPKPKSRGRREPMAGNGEGL